jgi:hypothetical protein
VPEHSVVGVGLSTLFLEAKRSRSMLLVIVLLVLEICAAVQTLLATVDCSNEDTREFLLISVFSHVP